MAKKRENSYKRRKRDEHTQWESANTVKNTRARSQWLCIKRPRLCTQQSTPYNPAHGLHTIHTLLFPFWKHMLTSTHAPSRTHTLPVLLHATTRMSPSLYNTLRDWFWCRNKTSKFWVLSPGWFKGNAAATVLWFVTCHRAKDALHHPKNRELQKSEENLDVFQN